MNRESGRVENEVRGLAEEWAAAELRGDTAFMEDTLADDFVGIGPRGFVLTREQWLERYRTGGLQNQAFAWEDVQVRDYGEAAVCVGIQAQRTTYQGHDASGRFRGTLVTVRRDRRWVIAGLHLSPLAEPPGR